ncbi:MAG: BtaA family protein [Candidatus Hydrogenedentes bacterium]|nr:BtaA family protein [Candidatus Hydrogenedentota bacterium]
MPSQFVSQFCFNRIHASNLVYNTCWEDPRIDRQALDLTPADSVLVITSAGCNALDYALAGAGRVHTVDMNHRQNALLELKLAGIRTLDYEDFFEVFGKGRKADFQRLYRNHLRTGLSEPAKAYWDRNWDFFDPAHSGKSFYFRGTSGAFAWIINRYLDFKPALRDGIDALLASECIEEQRRLYYEEIRERFWNRYVRWFIDRDMTLSMLGVPLRQRETVEQGHEGGIVGFVEGCIDAVFGHLPLHDNYFWRVYLTGAYTPTCCPEYLKPEGFQCLKDGAAEAVSVNTGTVRKFLEGYDGEISRFVLLDHMDWLWTDPNRELTREWQAIVDRASENARIIWRSGGMNTDFVNALEVERNGRTVRVDELLRYRKEQAEELHRHDRVHTYGSFYIADLAPAG